MSDDVSAETTGNCFSFGASDSVCGFGHANVVLAALFGLAFALDGVTGIVSAWLTRFPGWRTAARFGGLEFCIAVMLSGSAVVRLGPRLSSRGTVAPPAATPEPSARTLLHVHVWTPVGSATARDRRPVVDRYIAAVDVNRAISTGHAALEAPSGLHISHYPAVEIEQSSGDFTPIPRPPNETVVFETVNGASLAAFWQRYRADSVYNLTRRNCSSAVAAALDVAQEGTFAASGQPWRRVARALISADFWVACYLRGRADSMAWTPGLLLDYVQALARLLDRARPYPAARMPARPLRTEPSITD